MDSPVETPRDLLARVAELRAEALALEREALRRALIAADWLVGRAARQIDWSHGMLERVIGPGRRHEVLGRELHAHRPVRRRGRQPGVGVGVAEI